MAVIPGYAAKRDCEAIESREFKGHLRRRWATIKVAVPQTLAARPVRADIRAGGQSRRRPDPQCVRGPAHEPRWRKSPQPARCWNFLVRAERDQPPCIRRRDYRDVRLAALRGASWNHPRSGAAGRKPRGCRSTVEPLTGALRGGGRGADMRRRLYDTGGAGGDAASSGS